MKGTEAEKASSTRVRDICRALALYAKYAKSCVQASVKRVRMFGAIDYAMLGNRVRLVVTQHDNMTKT